MTREKAFQIAELVRTNKVSEIAEVAKKLLPCIMVINDHSAMIDINRFNAICRDENWL